MDLEEWEFIPDDGFLEIHDDGGKKIFSRKYVRSPKNVFNMDYFRCPSPKSQKFVDSTEDSRLPKQLIPLPIQLEYPVVGKKPHDDHEVLKEITKVPIVMTEKTKEDPPTTGAVEADQDAVSQVFFKKLKENKFVDMKMESPKSDNRGITPQIDAHPHQFEEKGEAMEVGKVDPSSKVIEEEMVIEEEEEEEVINWGESNEGLNIWKWSSSGIGAICSFGMAAATICVIIFGSGQRNKHHQKLRFQIYSEDKRMKQVVQHATKLNEAISAVRGAPLTSAHITYGGYYDGL